MDQTNETKTTTETPVIDQTKPPVVNQQVWWIEQLSRAEENPTIQTGIVTEANNYYCYISINSYGREYVSPGKMESLYYAQQEAEDKLALYKKKLEKEKSIKREATFWKIITIILSIAMVALAFIYFYQYPKMFIQDLLVFLAPYIGFITATFIILFLAMGIFVSIIDTIERTERKLKNKNLPDDFLKRDALKD